MQLQWGEAVLAELTRAQAGPHSMVSIAVVSIAIVSTAIVSMATVAQSRS